MTGSPPLNPVGCMVVCSSVGGYHPLFPLRIGDPPVVCVALAAPAAGRCTPAVGHYFRQGLVFYPSSSFTC